MKALIHPYGNLSGGEWLTGNLHTHTTRSDGFAEPQRVIDEYARRGYGFLAITDHDTFATDTECRSWNSRGMILVPGVEIGGGPHLVQIDGERMPAMHASRQEVLNEIVARRKETGRGFAIVAHPNWGATFDHATSAQLREWTGYAGVEIYNGATFWEDGSPYAVAKWDLLLASGRAVWGFANDDCHRAEGLGRAWNVAYVVERSVAGVCEAVYAGRFYASTGVTLRGIRVAGTTVRIETDTVCRIKAIRDTGRCIAMADADHLEVDVPENARYLRFECWGERESCAWTQPFFVPHDGEEKNAADRGVLREWRSSPLARGKNLSRATCTEGVAQARQPARCHPRGHMSDGFVDVRETVMGRGGVVYLATEFASGCAGQGVLRLGYDGPIRAWLNGGEVFFGPGTNPAIPDQLKLFVPVQRGTNRLVLALDSNGGKAWGIFARVDLPD